MLGDPELFPKVSVLVGESMFCHPVYGVDYTLMHELRSNDKISTFCQLMYVYEPGFREFLNETEAEKKARYLKIEQYGFPCSFLGNIELADAPKMSDYVIAPFLHRQFLKICSAKDFGPAVSLIVSTNNLCAQDYREAFARILHFYF